MSRNEELRGWPKVQGLYDRDELVIRKSTLDELPRLVNLATLFTLLTWLARHLVVIGAPHSATLLALWAALIVAITLGRMAARRLSARFAPRERLFLIGDAATAERMEAKLAHSSNAELVGVIGADEVERHEDALPELVALERREDPGANGDRGARAPGAIGLGATAPDRRYYIDVPRRYDAWYDPKGEDSRDAAERARRGSSRGGAVRTRP